MKSTGFKDLINVKIAGLPSVFDRLLVRYPANAINILTVCNAAPLLRLI